MVSVAALPYLPAPLVTAHSSSSDRPPASGARPARGDLRRRGLAAVRRLAVGLALAAITVGCALPSRQQAAGLPSRHQVRTGKLVIKSDFNLPEDDLRVTELHELRREVRDLLQLPDQRRPVVVYLFQDEQRYTSYMKAVHPNLPSRRAFFIGTPSELSVYAYWGEQVREDLRHEYTHGLLHSSLHQVPLWLDEGLAEFFEVQRESPDRINQEHAAGLAEMLVHGWQPNLRRMEQLDDVSQMQRADYQEAWAWTHFLLNDVTGRDLLLGYLRDLERPGNPAALSTRIAAELPRANERLTAYIASFATDVGRADVASSGSR